MSEADPFFGFNPRAVRAGLAAGAACCAALAAWALANAHSGAERFGVARAGVAAGLMFAFGYVFVRLRPRPGWGVTLTAVALVVARPFSQEPLHFAWSQISAVRREEGRRRALAIFLKSGERFLVPQHLFSGRGFFEEMAREIGSRVDDAMRLN